MAIEALETIDLQGRWNIIQYSTIGVAKQQVPVFKPTEKWVVSN